MKPSRKILTILSLFIAFQITMQNESTEKSKVSNEDQQMPSKLFN